MMKSSRANRKQRASELRSQLAALRSRSKGAPAEASPPALLPHPESPREFSERRTAELDKEAKNDKKLR